MEWLLAKLGMTAASTAMSYGIGGAVFLILTFIVKKLPQGAIKSKWGYFCYGVGVGITGGGSQWVKKFGKKWGPKIWNFIENFVITLIEDVFVFGPAELIRGMRSDNLTLKESIKQQTQVGSGANNTTAT